MLWLFLRMDANKLSAISRWIAWIPVFFSTGLLLVFVPFLLMSQRICLHTLISIPLFLAYLGLFAFPLVVFGANVLATKQISIRFETERRQVWLSFWMWTVLMLCVVGLSLAAGRNPLPGFDSLLSCTPHA